MANETVVPFSLDEYFQTQPVGSLDKAIGNNLYGINHMQVPGMVPMNKDQYGLTFFTRPQLNMQPDNIRNQRIFYPLLTKEARSIQRFVRTTLDPRLQIGYRFLNKSIPAISSPLVDPTQAFIPVLTNNLTSISGWPDIVAPVFTSDPGLYNEAIAMVDGKTTNYEVFDIEANFRNTRGDPIVYLFYIWLHYASNVFEGLLVPYMDMIVENEIDYNTRIYRLVLDQQRNIVTKIAATGAAFPVQVPTASFFDFNNEKPFNDQNKDIPVRFKCMGAIYNDDILVHEFNETTCIFNPLMRDAYREKELIRIGRADKGVYNNRGYPRINPTTYELEWWVSRDVYNNRSLAFLMDNLATNPDTTGDPIAETDPGAGN